MPWLWFSLASVLTGSMFMCAVVPFTNHILASARRRYESSGKTGKRIHNKKFLLLAFSYIPGTPNTNTPITFQLTKRITHTTRPRVSRSNFSNSAHLS
ncbi:hypothetical protein BDN72DRAFT_842007 [Pluteus cervinus]|uniref:Uncharacterized protein n=1 Tax=Pluteus cervinus TaxID=181527 RepID=A0ACD3ASD1_9AGAR|nr:hypothetical protein BDN72DRAFT_842007 [Pluteus cervinus]